MTSLTFGTGAAETRLFDSRYFPQSITLDAAEERTWTYQSDKVGNVEQIDENCTGDLVLSNDTVSTAESHQSCGSVTAGPAFTVSSSGDLTLQAGTLVALTNGFQVDAGGRLAIGTDPGLATVTKTYGYQDVDYFLHPGPTRATMCREGTLRLLRSRVSLAQVVKEYPPCQCLQARYC